MFKKTGLGTSLDILKDKVKDALKGKEASSEDMSIQGEQVSPPETTPPAVVPEVRKDK